MSQQRDFTHSIAAIQDPRSFSSSCTPKYSGIYSKFVTQLRNFIQNTFNKITRSLSFGRCQPDGYLDGKELVIFHYIGVVKSHCNFAMSFFHALCLGWDFIFNCIKS